MTQGPSTSHLRYQSPLLRPKKLTMVLLFLSMALLITLTSARSLPSNIITSTSASFNSYGRAQISGKRRQRAFLVNGRGGSTTGAVSSASSTAAGNDSDVDTKESNDLVDQMDNTIDNALHGNDKGDADDEPAPSITVKENEDEHENENEDESLEDIENVQDVEENEESETILTPQKEESKPDAAEAATALASPPLRISTSQMGNEIVTNDVTDDHLRRLTRREKRARRAARRKAKKEDSHKVYARNLKNRNSMNIKRKVFHVGSGLFFALLNQLLPSRIFIGGFTVVAAGTLFMECMRYRKGFGWMNDALNFCLGSVLRKHEMEGKFTGSFYYFCGVLFNSICFPKSCASLGIIQLALADPSASFFGRQTRHIYWSRIENGFFGIGRNKGMLGFLGGALVCFPFNYRVLSIAKIGAAAAGEVEITRKTLAATSLALGLAGAFADLCVPTPALTMPKKICGVPMPPLHVDDNIVVPIFSGYACTKIFEYLGWGTGGGVELAKFIVF